MYKRLLYFLVILSLAVVITTAHAASETFSDGMVKKLKRGAINTFTGWMEFPIQIRKGFEEGFMGNEENKLIGVVFGIYDGLLYSTGRTLSGITDIAGFWAANPKDNKDMGLPLDTEFAWEEGKPYNGLDPNFTEASVRPIVNKFFRGSGNLLFGFMELPKQVFKVKPKKSPDFGISKGLWYWLSREASGLSDLVTLVVPGPEDTKGIAFDEELSWDKPWAQR